MLRSRATIAIVITLLYSAIALGTALAHDRPQLYGEPGDWVVPEALPNRNERSGHGSCRLKLDLASDVGIRLGARGDSDATAPDATWAELSGRWQPLARALEQRMPRVRFEIVCGTWADHALETIRSPWLPVTANDRADFACPDQKPFMLAARCQTVTTRP